VIQFRHVTDGLSNTVAASEQTLGLGWSGGNGSSDLPGSTAPANAALQVLNLSASQNDTLTGTDTSPDNCTVGASGYWAGIRGARWMNGHYGDTLYNHGLAPNSPTFDCGNLSHNAGLTAARSRHAGGVNTLLCDGSVRFAGNNIHLGTWQALGSRAGGEVIGEF
jgi:prepilin-type processing-associated H-X9-DG protein